MTGRIRLLWAALFAATATAAVVATPAVLAGLSFRALEYRTARSEEHRPRLSGRGPRVETFNTCPQTLPDHRTAHHRKPTS